MSVCVCVSLCVLVAFNPCGLGYILQSYSVTVCINFRAVKLVSGALGICRVWIGIK